MRVLHISNYGTPHGGVFRYIDTLMRNARSDKRLVMKFLAIKKETGSISDFSLNMNIPTDLIFGRKKIEVGLDCIMKKFRPDVVHVHDITFATYEILKFLADRKISYIHSLHNFALVCPQTYYRRFGKECNLPFSNMCLACVRNKSQFYNFLCDKLAFRKNLFNNAHRQLSTSEKFTEIYRKSGFTKVMNLLLYAEGSEKIKPSYRFEKSKILYVGRLDCEKNPTLAIRLLSMLKDKTATIDFVGRGPEKKAVEKLAQKLNVSDRVRLHGFVEDSELDKFYKNANVFIHPTNWIEASSLVLFEAMAHGKAVFVANRGMVGKIVKHGQNGMLFDIDDEKDAAKKLDFMLETPELCIKMGKNARKTVEDMLTFNIHYKKLRKLYEEAVMKNRT